ncbi:MAG: hypothetical protein JXB07_11000 [Anaerolineae bacterium]|nr:hypothetical protein [Anaerolineae bacterium]
MSGLADQLKETIGKPEGQALSTLDLMSLPSSVRRVVNLMLRKVKASSKDLRQAVADLPEGKRLSPDELDEILDALCQVGWLAQEQSGDETIYRVNLSPKPGTASENSPLEMLEKEDIPSVQMPQMKPSAAGSKPSPSGGLMSRLKKIFGG